ncbi:hypothetical protein VTK56DRAFT_812 [Thermocarpiscus australiensis]
MLGLLGAVVYGTAIASVSADEPVDPIRRRIFGPRRADFVQICLEPSASSWVGRAIRNCPCHRLRPPLCRILLLGNEGCEGANSPLQYLEQPFVRHTYDHHFFSFISLGIYFWYMNIYMQTIRGNSLIQTGVQYLPLTIVGAINSFFAAWLVPRVPTQVIIGAGRFAIVTINVLLATIPANLTYWAMAFPAMFVSAFTIDLITTSAQIIASNTVPMEHQGVAGSLVATLLSYGMRTGLGFAGTVEVITFKNGTNLLKGYHSAAYLAVGMSGFAPLLCFYRIPKDTRETWAADDETAAARGHV